MAILIDASVLIAYMNVDDVHHANARDIMVDIKANKYGVETTTDYVFDEVLSVIHRKIGKAEATVIGRYIIESIPLTMMDDRIFVNAWNIFGKRKKLSFTDCTLLAFMEKYKIKHIATFDKGFRNIEHVTTIGV